MWPISPYEQFGQEALTKRRLDPATFQALQALVARGSLTVGARLAQAIRERRAEVGVSAAALAEHFGISNEDFEEIEAGGAISAPMLVELARALDVDLVWFIEREPSFLAGGDQGGPFDIDGVTLDAKEGLALLRAFSSIKDPAVRQKIVDLAQHFAEGGKPEGQDR
jgi:transcriptional regulator with XRE-family HTH domain